MTLSRSGFNRLNCVIISSVRPSLKYSWPGSGLKFSNGKTASMTFSAAGREGFSATRTGMVNR